MIVIKRIGAAAASFVILTFAPVAAMADCNGCFGGCIDMYGSDNSESGYHALSQCFNSCNDDLGRPCMGTIGG